ncbi:MAG: hypothetical protein WAT09_06650 [Paracoccaceae bacterium]
MTELRLSLKANAEQILAVSTLLANQTRDKGARKWLRLLVYPAGPVAALLAAPLIGVPANKTFLIALVTLYATLFAFWLANRAVMRLYGQALHASAVRNQPSPVSLSPEGLRMEARNFPWSQITAVARWNDMTLLQFSEVDAVTILDADLPPGETPPALAVRIAEWKAQ